MEPFFPLHAYVCESCFLVQLPEIQSPEEIFSDYAYFSSYSESWLEHVKSYSEMMVKRFGFGTKSQVIEIASNDGYLLKYFKEKGIPVLGIEPAQNVAKVALESGIPTITKFFGVQTAMALVSEGKLADLLIGNNVLAHVPDINDFVKGMKVLLRDTGIITVEVPHLMRLIENNQFDTIYHEHFSYFSLLTVKKIFNSHGLKIFDVEELSTHGGSLRVFACHSDNELKTVSERARDITTREQVAGLNSLEHYVSFKEKVKEIKRNTLYFLIEAKRRGKSIAAYGAPAKGNTLLNYCGIGTDFIEFTVDRSPYKQGHYLPGSRIPIYHPDKIKESKPEYVFILPWNLKEEISDQMSFIREWGGKFLVVIPNVKAW